MSLPAEYEVVPLSPAEYHVMTLVIQGLKYKEVARKLGRSPKTIEVHMIEIRAKLGARNVAHAAVIFDRMTRQRHNLGREP
jgi:DNA-binding NarL/FixJ family response regulator